MNVEKITPLHIRDVHWELLDFSVTVFYLIPSHLKPLSLYCESVADLWQCSFIWQSVHWISFTFICIRFLFLLFNGDCETVTIKQAQVLPFWQ